MIYSNEKEIMRFIKEKILPVYFICGDDSYLKKSCQSALVKQVFGGEPNDMNYEKIDGQFLDVERLCDSVEAMPFFAEKRCVLVYGFDADTLLKADKEKIIELIENPNPSTVQIYIAKNWESGEKPSAAENTFISAAEKAGAVLRFGKRTNTDLCKFIKSKAKTYNCEIEQKLCLKIIDCCGSDMQRIGSETDKLFAYRSGGEINEDDIDAVVTADIEARVFDLWSRIFKNNYLGAMELLGDLFYLREEPIAILGALSMNVIDVYRVKLGTADGKNISQIGKDLGIKSSFRLGKAQSFTKSLSLKYLRRVIDVLYEADIRLKSSPLENKIILEQAISKIFVIGQEEKIS